MEIKQKNGRENIALGSVFEYDVFLSFDSADEELVKSIWEKMNSSGLCVFCSNETLKPFLGKQPFLESIQDALIQSEHFVLICTENSMQSEWVKDEYQTFYGQCYIPSQRERRLVLLKIKDFDISSIPPLFRGIQQADSIDHIIIQILKQKNKFLSQRNEFLSQRIKILEILSEGFTGIVCDKTVEFDKHYNKPEINNECIFRAITNPIIRIQNLIYKLHYFLKITNSNLNFLVRMAKMKDDKPVDWFKHNAPPEKRPRTVIRELDFENSALRLCIKEREIIIIEDVEKESKKENPRFKITQKDQKGSLICYPVYHIETETHPYVIIISTPSVFFKETKKEYYEWILELFAVRIKLEHSLSLIREKNQSCLGSG